MRMKKNGFTLAELLIALAVVGVVAALLAPTLQNLMPNNDKTKFLKVYDSIATAAVNILDNSELYYGNSSTPDILTCRGFACDSDIKSREMSTHPDNFSYAGIAKHQCLISDILNVDNNYSCNPRNIQNRFSPISGIVVTMMTVNIKNNFLTNIEINMGNDRVYHIFMDNWGKLACGRFVGKNNSTITVTIDENDAIAQAYIDNRLKLNNRTEDLQIAEGLVNSYDIAIADPGEYLGGPNP